MDSGKTSPSVELPSTVRETLSKATSTIESEKLSVRSMVRKSPNLCVLPGLGNT